MQYLVVFYTCFRFRLGIKERPFDKMLFSAAGSIIYDDRLTILLQLSLVLFLSSVLYSLWWHAVKLLVAHSLLRCFFLVSLFLDLCWRVCLFCGELLGRGGMWNYFRIGLIYYLPHNFTAFHRPSMAVSQSCVQFSTCGCGVRQGFFVLDGAGSWSLERFLRNVLFNSSAFSSRFVSISVRIFLQVTCSAAFSASEIE